MSKRRRTLTPEESDLWRRVARQTTPLPGRTMPEAPKDSAKAKPPAAEKKSAPQKPSVHPKPSRPAPHDPFRTGLDAATARRVRRGKLKPEAKIDLHGMRQGEAHDALSRFILSCSHRGKRCVLVITGKGGGKTGDGHPEDADFMRGSFEDGILRRQVPLWLRHEPLRSKIFAVETAHQLDGGGGALYVFLRKIGGTP